MKKLFLIFIILIYAVLVNTTLVYADSFSDIKGDISEEAVELMSSYGIFVGYPDNTFRPNNAVNRAEMAKIITIAAGYYEYSKNMTSVYEDMHGHWAESYVELANVLNIVKGISSKTYGPDNYIKLEEAITMIVRLLGYTDESLNGHWPENYFEKANQLNILQNIDVNNEFATRRDVSIMLYNAFKCDLVEVRDNNTVYSTGKKLISLIGYIETREIEIDDLEFEGYDFTDYLFNKWDIYYDYNDNIVHISKPRYFEFSGDVTSHLSNRVIFVTDDYGNVRAFKLPNIPIVFNGCIGSFESLKNAKIRVVYEDNSNTGKVIGVVAYKPSDVIVLDRKSLYKNDSQYFAGKKLPVNSQNIVNFNKIHVFGDEQSLEEIKENDIVYFYESEKKDSNAALNIEVIRKNVEGTVTSVETTNNEIYYTINNNKYKASENFIFTEDVSVKDIVTLLLDKNNEIMKMNILKYGKEPATHGIVLSTSNGLNNNAKVKILDEYGRLKTYELASNSSVVKVNYLETDVQYISLLKKNDIVKFDPDSQGVIKIIKLQPSKYIGSSFNILTNTFANGFKITSSTFIAYENNGIYQLLKTDQLGEYIEGKAEIGYNNNIEALFLTKGIKAENYVTPIPDVPKNYDGTIYDIIKEIKDIDEYTAQVEFFNNNNKVSVSRSSNEGKKLSSMMNYYVKAVIDNGVIKSIERVTPETDKIKISAVYSNQLQIDSITYMEYTSNLKVLICTTNESGIITNVKLGSKSDIKQGSTAQLYDLYGSFDGIIDVVLLFN